MQDDYRKALVNFLTSEKDTRPHWQTEHRGTVMPLVKSGYNDSVSYGVPALLGGHGWATMSDIVSGNPVSKDEIQSAAGDVAGAAMTGSFALARPHGSVGSGGALSATASKTAGPVRAYHGTPYQFDKFSVPRELGPHFGTPEQANARLIVKNNLDDSVANQSGYASGSNIIPVDIDVRNPFEMRDMVTWRPRQIADELAKMSDAYAGLPKKVADFYRRDESGRNSILASDKAANSEIRNRLLADGYDSIRYRNSVEGDGDSYVALTPGTVRSATTGEIMFSNARPAASVPLLNQIEKQSRSVDPLGYYSQALEVAKGLQNKGSPDQYLSAMRNAGVKQAEIDATGLGNAFSGQSSITRDDLVKHLTDNRVGLNEKTYGDVPDFPGNTLSGEAKWSSHSLDPSNPSYRETVLHLPDKSGMSESDNIANMLADIGNMQAGMAGDGFTLFPITPKMREEARKGLPLFQSGVPMQGSGQDEDYRNALINYLTNGK